MTTQEILQGVHDWTNGKIVYDISVAHHDGQGNPIKYADLTAALGTGGANIPEALQNGGMSVKFVQSSDNKYVQARCMAQNFTTDVTQWQVVDDKPTAGSDNLVKSGGVEKEIVKKIVNCYVGANSLNNDADSLSIRYRVIPGKKYYIDTKVALQSLFYTFTDEEENYIGTRKDNRTVSKHIEEAPENSYYLYVCVSYIGNGSVGVSDVGDYFDYISDIQINKENISTLNENVEECQEVISRISETKLSKNVYDYSTVGVVNGIIGTNGKITTSYDGFCTGLIPVLPNHYYHLSNRANDVRSIRCLQSDGITYMKVLAPSNGQEYGNYYMPNVDASSGTNNGQFKTPSDAAYLQITLTPLNTTQLGDYYKIMLEDVGSVYDPDFVPSEYEEGGDETIIKNEAIEKDKIPTENSNKPVESGGVYNALKNNKKKLKVLLIGSSHGVNTISMFPVLAYHAGVDIVCGNLYSGSATLGFYTSRPAVQIPYMADNDVSFNRFAVYENGGWTRKATTTISYALSLYDWDVIILQRGASEDYWNNSISNFYQHILDYIKYNCDYNPRIYFNSGIANAYKKVDGDYQDTCLKETNILMQTAYEQESEFGISVIPTAVAVQYARKTCLKNTGQFIGSSVQYQCMVCDVQHLDTGVGQYVTACTVFEKILKDFFNISVRELDYLPTYSDVSGNVINEGSEYFTTITDYYSRIAKTCAALAVKDKEVNSETTTMLASRYGNLPTTYNIIYNLTGCTLDVDDTTIDSDEVFMAQLTLDSGYTMPEGGVVVTVGGNDVTATVYATYDGYYAIRIGEITGDITITAVAESL